MNDIDFNKKLLEACDSCASADTSESHSYKKEFSTQTGSVSVDASADSVDELKMLLQKVGITLPGGGPAATQMHYADPIELDHAEEPEAEEVCDDCGKPGSECDCPGHDHSQEEPTKPYNSGTPDKQVLTNIIRDKLKAYLMNGSK